jgi:hypothetical protein
MASSQDKAIALKDAYINDQALNLTENLKGTLGSQVGGLQARELTPSERAILGHEIVPYEGNRGNYAIRTLDNPPPKKSRLSPIQKEILNQPIVPYEGNDGKSSSSRSEAMSRANARTSEMFRESNAPRRRRRRNLSGLQNAIRNAGDSYHRETQRQSEQMLRNARTRPKSYDLKQGYGGNYSLTPNYYY